MNDLFARALLGHLTGDYLMQNRAMAILKGERGWRGVGWCTLHAIGYTAACCVWLWTARPVAVIAIFTTHWVIDRWSLGQKWLDFIHGRSFPQAYASREKYHEVDLAFSCLVYAVVDNTLHLIVLWVLAQTTLR